MIRRGFLYEVEPKGGDPKPRRLVLILSPDARNRHPAIETVIAVPLTTRVRRFPWRVLLPKGTGGVPIRSEAACELIGQWAKSRFRRLRGGEPRPLGGPIPSTHFDAILDAIHAAVGF